MALLHYPENLRLYNDVLVMSNKESDDEFQLSNLTLIKDTTYDKQRSKRIWATVAALPYALRRTRIHQNDFTHPVSKGYFPGEAIERQVNKYEEYLRRKLQTKELKKFKDKYSSGHYEPDFTCIDDQPIAGRVGDKAYFHYLSLCDETYMGQDDNHNRYYRVPYESIFCFVGENGLTMVNGYMQVAPYWNEDYDEIEVAGKIVRGKLKGNLVISVAEKPEFRTGVVTARGANYSKDTRDLIIEGDVVIYRKGSEFKNRIEGKEVFLMPQWQIMAVKRSGKLVPSGDYVQLRVKQKKGMILTLKDVLEDTATVLRAGENCNYVRTGDRVIFNTGAEFFNIEDTILLREGHILARYED